MIIPDNLIPILDEMLMDLSTNHLEVCLIPSKIPECARDGGMIRAVTSQNPVWYQDLCRSYPCTRSKKRNRKKDDTKIKRQYILSVLENMIKKKSSNSMYDKDLLNFAKSFYDLYEKLFEESLIPWEDQF